MGENSAIEWTDHTFNPWWGCVKVSPGCKNCYAETLSSRWQHDCWGTSPRRLFGEKHWAAPLRWKPGRVFCGSMCDVLEPIPQLDLERANLWCLIRKTPHLTWMLLTKRPQNADLIPDDIMPRIWFGISAEDQERFYERSQHLPPAAALRFLSYEPALGPLIPYAHTMRAEGLNWIIAGGESGPHHRPANAEWFRAIRDACLIAGKPFFFKQWGGATPKSGGKVLDGEEWCQIPQHD